jgi:hypothetical protein
MSVQSTSEAGTTFVASGQSGFQVRSWVIANALGLALVYALWALFAGVVEALGAGHESVVRDLSGLAGFLLGATAFTYLRYRALAGRVAWSTVGALAAGIGLAVGFVVGFVIAGPPVDFLLGVVALGTIGSGLQWRRFRHHVPRSGGLLAAGIFGWIGAGVVAVVVAILLGDAVDGLFGSGVPGFVAVTAMLGLAGGATGGAVEGRALASRIDNDPERAETREV